ncbi:MAG: TA system VapC family ribonuclease toxin [Opitutaceae bacterium]
MKGFLLDVNTLLALAWPNHVQHRPANEWFERESKRGWGTCSVTQIGFVRICSHPAFEHHVSTQEALQKLKEIAAVPGHSFWPGPADGCASESLGHVAPRILTHGMVTDGFLAGVAKFNGGKLATFDKALARAFPDCCALVGVSP